MPLREREEAQALLSGCGSSDDGGDLENDHDPPGGGGAPRAGAHDDFAGRRRRRGKRLPARPELVRGAWTLPLTRRRVSRRGRADPAASVQPEQSTGWASSKRDIDGPERLPCRAAPRAADFRQIPLIKQDLPGLTPWSDSVHPEIFGISTDPSKQLHATKEVQALPWRH